MERESQGGRNVAGMCIASVVHHGRYPNIQRRGALAAGVPSSGVGLVRERESLKRGGGDSPVAAQPVRLPAFACPFRVPAQGWGGEMKDKKQKERQGSDVPASRVRRVCRRTETRRRPSFCVRAALERVITVRKKKKRKKRGQNKKKKVYSTYLRWQARRVCLRGPRKRGDLLNAC